QKSRDEIRRITDVTKESLLKTVDHLSTEFGIYSFDFLPYEAIGIILCFVFSKIDALDAAQSSRVRQWFWRSAFNERYRGASEHYISKDLESILSFVILNATKADIFGPAPSADLWTEASFRSNNSRSRAFVLALALRGPRNLTNGSVIDTS